MTRRAIAAVVPLVLVLGLMAGGAALWDHHATVAELHPANPRAVPLTPQQDAAIRSRTGYREELAMEVVHGDLSFEEAGCAYRGGEWSGEAERCSAPR